MIVVDTSALMAILLHEANAAECGEVLAGHGTILMSTATLAEALIVSARRGLASEMRALVDGLAFEFDRTSPAAARNAAAAHDRWGKGRHVAGLNFGDCFAYELAKRRNLPLLCVGNDFARTDIATLPG